MLKINEKRMLEDLMCCFSPSCFTMFTYFIQHFCFLSSELVSCIVRSFVLSVPFFIDCHMRAIVPSCTTSTEHKECKNIKEIISVTFSLSYVCTMYEMCCMLLLAAAMWKRFSHAISDLEIYNIESSFWWVAFCLLHYYIM